MTFLEWLKALFTPTPQKPADVIPIKPIENVSPVGLGSPTPWMDWMQARLGWNETNNNKQLASYWKYVGLDYTDVIGADHAWCAMTVNAALIESGYKGNHRADAVSFCTYGLPCEDKDGAIIVIEHPSGHHHVTFRWKGKLFGGNQQDSICIEDKDPRDQIIAVRWPVKA